MKNLLLILALFALPYFITAQADLTITSICADEFPHQAGGFIIHKAWVKNIGNEISDSTLISVGKSTSGNLGNSAPVITPLDLAPIEPGDSVFMELPYYYEEGQFEGDSYWLPGFCFGNGFYNDYFISVLGYGSIPIDFYCKKTPTTLELNLTTIDTLGIYGNIPVELELINSGDVDAYNIMTRVTHPSYPTNYDVFTINEYTSGFIITQGCYGVPEQPKDWIIPHLPAGDTAYISIHRDIGFMPTDSIYTITYHAISGHLTNPANGAVSVTKDIVVPDFPELTVAYECPENFPLLGEILQYDFLVTNEGTVAYDGGTVEMFLSVKNENFPLGITHLIPGIEPEETYQFSMNYAVPEDYLFVPEFCYEDFEIKGLRVFGNAFNSSLDFYCKKENGSFELDVAPVSDYIDEDGYIEVKITVENTGDVALHHIISEFDENFYDLEVVGTSAGTLGLTCTYFNSDFYYWHLETLEAGESETIQLRLKYFEEIEPNDELDFSVATNCHHLIVQDTKTDHHIFTVEEEQTTSIFDKENLRNTLSFVYPNPTRSFLNLQIESKQVISNTLFVYNVLGELVFEKQISIGTGENHFSVDLTSLNNGLYKLYIPSYGVKSFVKY